MTASLPTERLSYYPRFLFPHSPTYHEWARLSAKDVHERLHQRREFEGQDVWFYSNHPIRWVRVVGIVVAYDNLEKSTNITLDDGSGYLLELIAWKGNPPNGEKQRFSPENLKGVSLHSIIKAKGSVGKFRGNKQLLLRKISVLHDTNDEVNAWRETIRFKKNVLSKPWSLTEEFIRKERKGLAEAAEEERKREKQRKEERKLKREAKKRKAGGTLGKSRGKGKTGSEDPWEKQVWVEEVAAEISYRGHRRLPGSERPEQLLSEKGSQDQPTFQREETPQLSASESTFRGHRRRSSRLRPPPVPPDLKPDSRLAPPLPEAGRYSTLRPPKTHGTQLDENGIEPDYKPSGHLSPALELEPELHPRSQRSVTPESSFRGHRRASRPPLQLTVSNVALLEKSTSSEIQEDPELQPSIKARFYDDQRRCIGSESTAAINPTLREEPPHPPSKLETILSSPPEVIRRSRSSRYSPRRLRIPVTDSFCDTTPKAGPSVPTPEQQVLSNMESSTSTYRGRRRRAGSETTSIVEPAIKRTKLETVKPPPPLAEYPEPSYRGRRRRGGVGTGSQRGRKSSVLPNPTEQMGHHQHRVESTVPGSSVPPSSGGTSRYCGGRRRQIAGS